MTQNRDPDIAKVRMIILHLFNYLIGKFYSVICNWIRENYPSMGPSDQNMYISWYCIACSRKQKILCLNCIVMSYMWLYLWIKLWNCTLNVITDTDIVKLFYFFSWRGTCLWILMLTYRDVSFIFIGEIVEN